MANFRTVIVPIYKLTVEAAGLGSLRPNVFLYGNLSEFQSVDRGSQSRPFDRNDASSSS